MITTVTLNPCIDLTVHIQALTPGELHLTDNARTDVCGKGVNVSLVLRELGLATFCTGISYDGEGRQLEDKLEMHGICRRFALAHGHMRTNIKVFDEEKRQLTEINHTGHPVEGVVVEEYLRLLCDCALRSELLVFSGRIPPGAPPDLYRRSLKLVKKLGCKSIVDTQGEPLKLALSQRPYLVKPNLHELCTTFRCKPCGVEEIVGVCRQKLIAKGVSVVCVSLGPDGAVIVDAQEAFRAPALDVEVRGLQGAGDSMVAGICKAIKERRGIDDMLRFGMAAASASLLREGTQLCRRDDYRRLVGQVRLEQLKLPPLPQAPAKTKTRKSGNPI